MVVLDAHGHLAGIVTDRDLTVRGLGNGLEPDTAVHAVMTREVEWAGEDIDVFEAATKMVERGVVGFRSSTSAVTSPGS